MNIKIKFDKKKALDLLFKTKAIAIKKKRWFLIALTTIALAYCIFLWYKFIVNPKWSEEKKQAYVVSREEKSSFKQAKFNSIIAEIERRKGEYNRKIENIPDIFRLK